jgi:DNA-directed RNA polymerase II subunit RPB4
MAGLTPLAQTARRRPKPAGDEEASSVLKLGEMSNSAALSTAAAHELLLKIEEARGKDPKLPLTHNDLITKNNTYLEVFARFKGSDTVQQVTSEAETLTQLAEFERAQLGEFSSWASDGFLNGWWGVLAGQRAVHWIEYQPA